MTRMEKDTFEANLQFGQRLKKLRRNAGLTLQEVADRARLGVSTISKIENARSSPTYDVLLRLARGLEIDLSVLIEEPGSANLTAVRGRMCVSRHGEGTKLEVGPYVYEPMATGLLHKKIDPTLVRIKARKVEDFEALVSHPGEELVYVVSGEVELHSSLYAPVRLKAGDSVYYDAHMGHAYISVSKEDAFILNIATGGTRPNGVE